MIIDKPFEGIFDGSDVEAQVKEYMDLLKEYTGGEPYKVRERKIHKRVKIPDEYNISINEMKSLTRAKQKMINDWWMEQERRMDEGHDGMCGLQYGYFNFKKFFGGKRTDRPDYRRNDNELFYLISSCIFGDNEYFKGYKNWGITEIGRRRSGKSEKIGWLTVHLARKRKNAAVIITSKTQDDAAKVVLRQKVRFTYDSLPLPLKPTLLNSSQTNFYLAKDGKDADGNRQIKGRQMIVSALPPKSTSAEGQTIIAWIHDEQGKTKNLYSLFSNTVEALNDAEGFNREGFVYLTGVAGDFNIHGQDAITIWESAHEFQLIRWFTPGWVGLECDEYGNENIEKAVRMILTDRNKVITNRRLSEEERMTVLIGKQQKYPLTVEEALQVSNEGQLFNAEKLRSRKKELREDPVNWMAGEMRWRIPKAIADFHPASHGRFHMLEIPKPEQKYIIGVDCYGMKQSNKGSNGVATMFKLRDASISPIQMNHMANELMECKTNQERLAIHLKMGHILVGHYIDRHPDPTVFADNVAKWAIWAHRLTAIDNPVKILAETAPGEILSHLLREYPHLVMNSPIRPDRPPTKQFLSEKWGIDMKEYWRGESIKEVSHYVEQHYDKMYWLELVEKMMKYDPDWKAGRKYDEVDSFAVSLVFAADPRVKQWIEKAIEKPMTRQRKIAFRRV